MTRSNFVSFIQKEFPGASDVKELEAGGNGIPFRFKWQNKLYFIKIIDPNRAEKKLLGNEEEALKKVKSRYVIELLKEDYFAGTKFKYLLFPYIDGHDLHDLISQKRKIGQRFSDEELRNIGLQIARGIADMWKVGVAHQDIKPRNIRVDSQGKALILDLGIARFRDNPRKAKGKGSYRYSSPQQIRAFLGEDDDMFADRYFSDDHFALGTILYEMVTLAYPYGSGEPDEINKVVPAPLLEKIPSIDPQLNRIIGKLISKSSTSRYYSPERLILAFEGKDAVEHKVFETPVVFYQQGHSSAGGYQYFFNEYQYKVGNPEENTLKGVIFSTSYMPKEEYLKNTITRGYQIIIDPETYKLVYEHQITDKMRDTNFGTRKLKIDDFLTPGFADKWVKQVIDYQIEMGATILISPYFLVENPDEPWNKLTFTLLDSAAKYVKEKNITLPLFAGIALSRSIICNQTSKEKILENLIFRNNIQGVFLLVESDREGGVPCSDVDFIKELSAFIGLLERRFSVILPRFDVSALFLVTNGLSAFGTNPHPSLRRFSITQLKQEREDIGGITRVDKVFIPEMMTFIRLEEFADLVRRGLVTDLLVEETPFRSRSKIESGDINSSADDRNNDYLFCISETVKSMGKLSKRDRSVFLRDLITKAVNSYQTINQQGVPLHNHSKGDFLIRWQTISP